ncbi:hypothetical protein DESC_830089 [Desulfosarcina cetonica]|nr:hypothetical protein DESC_830089 [Desulfosarcina cetonica]
MIARYNPANQCHEILSLEAPFQKLQQEPLVNGVKIVLDVNLHIPGVFAQFRLDVSYAAMNPLVRAACKRGCNHGAINQRSRQVHYCMVQYPILETGCMDYPFFRIENPKLFELPFRHPTGEYIPAQLVQIMIQAMEKRLHLRTVALGPGCVFGCFGKVMETSNIF